MIPSKIRYMLKKMHMRNNLGIIIAVMLVIFEIHMLVNMISTVKSTGIKRHIFKKSCFQPSLGKLGELKIKSYRDFSPNVTQRDRPLVCNNCFPHDYSYMINNVNTCSGNNSQHVIIVATVLSRPTNFITRAVIRETWGSLSNSNTIRLVFLLGRHISEDVNDCVRFENNIYRDIIQEDFLDTYENLTLKTIMGLKWAITYCPNAKFILKTDDDMFIHFHNLLNVLFTHDLQHSVGGGCFNYTPIREVNSKWYVPHHLFPDYYPPIQACYGTAYVVPMDLAFDLLEVSPNVPYFPLEDVYIGLSIHHLNELDKRRNRQKTLEQNVNSYKAGKGVLFSKQMSPGRFQMNGHDVQSLRKFEHKTLPGFYLLRLRTHHIKFFCDCIVTAHDIPFFQISQLWRLLKEADSCIFPTVHFVGSQYCLLSQDIIDAQELASYHKKKMMEEVRNKTLLMSKQQIRSNN